MEQHYIVNVEGAIVRDGRFLMAVRSEQEAHAPGTLALVGGKVDVPVTVDGAAFTAQKPLGVMVVVYDNAAGKDEAILVKAK